MSRRKLIQPIPRKAVKSHALKQYVAASRLTLDDNERIQYTNASATGPNAQQAEVPALMDPGYEQIYSFYAPSLVSGQHHIAVQQTITDRTASLEPTASQSFEVVGPRFNLPDGEIHSCYPPQGTGDLLNILPHVVLEDPQLPWSRPASSAGNATNDVNTRSRLPWLALFVFEQAELRLPDNALNGDGKIFKHNTTQSATWSVNMSIDELWTMQNQKSITTPVQSTTDDPISPDTSAQDYDFIFLTPTVFKDHFSAYDNDGKPLANQSTADISRYEYLSHVRNINTNGMPDGLTGGDDQGLFSVVVAHRTGSSSWQSPTPLVVHLVSIENVDNLQIQQETAYVVLNSLYSWSYICLPADSFNCYDTMNTLCEQVNVLAAPVGTMESNPISEVVSARVKDGFTLGNWRTGSGEETLAMWRGPFTPVEVSHGLNHQSTFSSDLQVLDPDIGIMDLSYSNAWELGKIMAIADQPFAAAIARMRSFVHDHSYQAIKSQIMGSDKTNPSAIAAKLTAHVDRLKDIAYVGSTLNGSNKWLPKSGTNEDTGFFSPIVRQDFLSSAIEVVKQKLAASTSSTTSNYQFYNEHNKPVSTDWALMLDWVLNKLFFYGVPAQYLITEPSILPKEAMRFFLIDPNWTDAFLDGALSICNHIEGDDDQIRTAIKTVLNDYLTTIDPTIEYAPQIPSSGFLLRSTLVKQLPDIVVQAKWDNSQQLPIIRQDFLADDTLLVLFNRVPGDGHLVSVVITQPPHQQCFAAADLIDEQIVANASTLNFEVAYKQIYNDTTNERSGLARQQDILRQKWTQDLKSQLCSAQSQTWDFSTAQWYPMTSVNPVDYNVYDWNSRCLIFPAYAQKLTTVLLSQMGIPNAYTDKICNSAAVAIQLNEPMYYLEVDVSHLAAAHGLTAQRSSSWPGAVLKTLKRHRREAISDSPRAMPSLSTSSDRQISHRTSISPRVESDLISSDSDKRTSAAARSRLAIRSAGTSMLPLQLTSSNPPLPITRPQFQLTCHQAGSSQGSNISTTANAPLDLIFGVNFAGETSIWNDGYRLSRLWIVFDLGDVHTPYCLTNFYSGEGGSMLSNLRCNAIVESTSASTKGQPTQLQFILMPRSSTAPPPLSKCSEMGFIISGVEVNKYVIDQQWTPKAYEQYQLGLGSQAILSEPILNGTLTMNLSPQVSATS